MQSMKLNQNINKSKTIAIKENGNEGKGVSRNRRGGIILNLSKSVDNLQRAIAKDA